VIRKPGKLIFALAISALWFSGCSKVVAIGDSKRPEQMKHPEGNKISPKRALDLAKPHLAKSWDLGCQRHSSKHWCEKPGIVHIVQKGDYYYLRKTSYPYKTLNAYLKYAVKVHVNSGSVTPPGNLSRKRE